MKKNAPTADGDEGDEEGEAGEGRKSKKDIMSELIAKSKYYKVREISIVTNTFLTPSLCRWKDKRFVKRTRN